MRAISRGLLFNIEREIFQQKTTLVARRMLFLIIPYSKSKCQ